MMQTRFLLCAVPAEIWGEQASLKEPLLTLQALIKDALAVERRLPKGVNLENERSRYTLCCQQIESITSQYISLFKNGDEFKAALQGGRFPSFFIDEWYLHFLFYIEGNTAMRNEAAASRLGASFFAPDEVTTHNATFKGLTQRDQWHERTAIKSRTKFFEWAAAMNCGVIEIQLPLATVAQETAVPDVMRTTPVQPPMWIDSSTLVEEVVTGSRRTKMIRRLRSQIARAVKTGDTVNVSNQPHDITTEVLNQFVYQVGRSEPERIRIVYADGSEGERFPLRHPIAHPREQLARLQTMRPLRVALISMRHLELDSVVDIAWYRNREASRSRTLAEADDFCYQFSLKEFIELRELSERHRGVHVHLYHTGFEPAVLGFYRAFLTRLLEWKGGFPGILVVPHYYRRDRGETTYVPGTAWF